MYKPFILFFFLITACQLRSPQEQAIDLFEAYQGNKPGAAVLVLQDGKPVFQHAFGKALLEEHRAVTPQTNFRLASVTKQFTALAVLICIDRGLLTLQTTLGQLFPDFPEYGRNITVDQIIHHRSGLQAYENLIPDTVRQQVLDADVLQLMKTQDSTYFTPGSKYRYSNTGYAVLAMIVEKVSWKSFASFLRDEIFMPLGMEHTVAYEKGKSQVAHRAFGYAVTDSGVFDSDQSTYSAVLGDGGIYSSLVDLATWDQALYHLNLVSDSLRQLIFKPQLENYGCGWRIDTYKGHRRVHHTGSTSGFRNVIQRFPDDKFTVIILTNRKEPGVAPLAEKLVDLFLIR